MLSRFRKVKNKAILHVDHMYISMNNLVISGWFFDKKETSHINNIRNELALFVDGDESDFDVVTYKRHDLENKFSPCIFPEHFGFIIKSKLIADTLPEVVLKHGKLETNLNSSFKGLVNELQVFVQQAGTDSEKVKIFLHEIMDAKITTDSMVIKAPVINDSPEVSIMRDLTIQLESFGIDWDAFSAENNLPEGVNSIAYYLANKNTQEFVVGDDFSTKFYKETYPDIANSNVDPMMHYFLNGNNEGRLGSFQALINEHYVTGEQKYNAELPTIAIVCHESSATGAPLVGLNLGFSLNESHNVIHIVLHESSLQEEFVNNSVFTLTHLRNKDTATIQMLIKWLNETFKLDSIICNSVETYPVLEAASELKIPIISLLHEFSEYTRPRGKITNTIIHSDKVIVPARIIAESAFKEMSDYFGIKNKTNNIVVLPQGKLPFIPESNGTNFTVDELRKKFNIDEKQHKVVVGAGYVQTRKGVDLFIDAAFKIKQDSPVDCKFIWVGGGFEPEYDIGCSVWLQSQLDEFGLTDDFFFLSHQKSLDDIFALADAYLLTSRLDPFPNVMIDALQADLPVVCFDRTTGCAEFLLENKSVSAVVPFLDTAMMAEKTIAFLVDNKSKNNTHKNINSALVKEKLCFQSYVTSLLNIIEESKQLITKRTQIENVIIDSELFNTRFYGQTGDSQLAIEYYVKTSLNGIHSSSPLPGFSLGKWFESTQPESVYVVPLYEAIRSGKDLETHECQMITGGLSSISKKKIAVHLHLYYVDLAEDFATYFSCLPVGFDLYITVCESGIQDKVKDVFSVSGANIIDVIEVENIGRDVAPFFISLKDKIYQKGYDIIGHFHSKKSNDVDQGTGDRWRKYLLSNLIGSIPAVNEIFQSFESNSVGLVFAEDSHNVDFGKNKPFSDKLCNAMFIDKLESATLFPLGTMFWAKPEALSPLFELNMKEFLQPEPLPYDGSYMHAIERLISHVVTNTGYKIVSVYTQNTKW